MGNSSVMGSYQHIGAYEERAKVREIDRTLSRCLESKPDRVTECFSKALEALEEVVWQKNADIMPRIGERAESSLLPEGAPFVAEEMKRIMLHPQAQKAIAMREQERFRQCVNQWNRDQETDCWSKARARLEEIKQIQSQGNEGYKKMMEELRNRVFASHLKEVGFFN